MQVVPCRMRLTIPRLLTAHSIPSPVASVLSAVEGMYVLSLACSVYNLKCLLRQAPFTAIQDDPSPRVWRMKDCSPCATAAAAKFPRRQKFDGSGQRWSWLAIVKSLHEAQRHELGSPNVPCQAVLSHSVLCSTPLCTSGKKRAMH